MSAADGLTLKQRLFCEFYVGEASGNATEAARLAGYSGSAPTLRQMGRENLTKPHVFAYVEQLLAEMQEAGDALTPAEIHAFGREIVTDETVAPKDRISAARDAARANAMFVDRVEHSGAVGVGVQIYLPSNGREAGGEEE